jgi:hypothetical protein
VTTIAFDGTTLASDRMMAGAHNVPKIFKLKDGRYAAGCGDYDYITEIVHWLNLGSPRSNMPDLPSKNDGCAVADVIVADPKGRVVWLTWPFLREQRLAEKQLAWGSGSEFALGAMAAGATARQAVAIASRYDKHTGQGIDAVRVVKAKT